MKNKDKNTKKGLFKITKARAAIGTTIGALVLGGAVTIFSHVFPFNTNHNDLNNNNQSLEQFIEDDENNETLENTPDTPSEPEEPVVETPAPEEPVIEPEDDGKGDDETLEDETLKPGDPGYYFDEDDEEDLVEDDFADLVIPNINAYKGMGHSIVNALNYCGYPSDAAYRARLAAFFGIEDYNRTAEQNLMLLDYLYQYYAYLDNGQDNHTQNDEKHTCSFGDWGKLDDNLEVRTCNCGKQETRPHPGYGPWIDLGNGKEVRFCTGCGHVQERTKQEENECEHRLGAWTSIDDTYEVRRCSCGDKEEKQRHPYGDWKDNGDGREVRICPNCHHKQYRTKHEENECDHTLGAWTSIDDTYEVRRCSCGDKEEKQEHPYGDWKDNGDGREVHECLNCHHKQYRTKQENCDHTLAWTDNHDGTCTGKCGCGQETVTQAHVKGTLISTDYVIDGDQYIEVKTYTCANCKASFVEKTVLGTIVKEFVDGNSDTHNLVCTVNGEKKILGTENHTLGTATITYRDNGDGTHTKVSTYHCSGCNHDVVIEEKHGLGDAEVTCRNNDNGTHTTVTTYHCPDCGIDIIKEGNTQDCGSYLEKYSGEFAYADEYCFIEKDVCSKCGWETNEEKAPHVPNADGECDNCGLPGVSQIQSLQEFDHEVASDDDFDYDIDENDDFDLQEEDIPETAFLELDREDIEYMADQAFLRAAIEDALNEEFEAEKTLGLRL